ncbi:MAG: 3-phosphoshikimate 1-carboxyvinyltransferase [Clostridia bacterium]|nr:3-phosphoshikimate 1-carboxyvinyltransferase [Clostridia bacterium]
MIFTFTKSPTGGAIPAIPSKSAAHRLLICAAFADAPCTIICPVTSEDIDATARVLNALGANITRTGDGFSVIPVGTVQRGAILDCGESGSTLRFMLPVAAAIGAQARFVRHGRLAQRPLSPLYEEMARHGAILPDDAAIDPLTVGGRMTAGEYTIAANVSSQFVSGLLLAMPLTGGKCAVNLTDRIESEDYIRITASAMARFGAAPAVSADGRRYEGGILPYRSPENCTVEGDWSNAALWLAAGAIGKEPVTVTGLDPDSPQGDRRIADVLRAFGAAVTVEGDRVTAAPAPLSGITLDMSQIPDLTPVISAVAAAAKGETVIAGIARLRIKESDRAAAIEEMLTSLGADARAEEDRIVIRGGHPLHGGTVSSVRDHRMVMCASLLANLADGDVSVTEAEAIRKSYPGFAEDFRKLGGILTESEA